jgi:hypothetical protein
VTGVTGPTEVVETVPGGFTEITPIQPGPDEVDKVDVAGNEITYSVESDASLTYSVEAPPDACPDDATFSATVTDLAAPECYAAEVWSSEPICEGPAPVRFTRGDVDASGSYNITDGIYIFSYLFIGGPPPPCDDAADANDDGKLDMSDGIYILQYLFVGGPPPPDPSPRKECLGTTDCCGLDPTDEDPLGCESFPLCAPSP